MKQTVEEWIERGNHDLEVAKILLTEKEYFDIRQDLLLIIRLNKLKKEGYHVTLQ